MPNYKEDRPNSSPFQNGTDQHDRRASHDSGPPHIPHDQLVTHFRSFITQDQERRRQHNLDTSPMDIIRSKLHWESGPAHTDPETYSKAFHFWDPVISAWDALVYDRYKPNTFDWSVATSRLSGKRVIQLTRYQAGIIDALTEAAGIPHQKGQTAIAIPEQVEANSKSVEESGQEVWLRMCMGMGERLLKK